MNISVRITIATLAIGACLLAAGAAWLAAPARAGTTQSAGASPRSYYLALGDSIAYGAQSAKLSAKLAPSGFDTGYVDVFAARLRAITPQIRVVNYSCPGESTRTFVAGGCSGRADVRGLHDPFRGTQLDAALAFLRAHPGQVSPVTLTLWGNDFLELVDICKGDLGCVRSHARRAYAQVGSRLTAVVKRLRAAAPNAEIILTGTWNFIVDDLEATEPLFRSLDATIARAAAAGKAHVARIYPVFNPQGNIAREKARVCAMTFICSRDDPHPTDAGYRAIAGAVWAASGYGKGA